MTLTLTKDFTFTEHTKALSCVDRSISSNTISGTFKISKNRLILTPKKLLYYDFQGNCSKLEETDTIIKSGCFITEYKIVKYKDLILLLNDFTNTGNYPNDFIDIANSINRKDSNTEIRYIWKNVDNNSITVGKDIADSFPPPWNEYILIKPIVGKVIASNRVCKVDKAQYKYLDPASKYIFTLDIGKEAGIREKMRLYAQGENVCFCEFIILAVEAKQCKGFVSQFQEKNCIKNMEYSTKE